MSSPGARADTVAVMTQFLEHPLSVDAASVGRMVEDVNLPEGQQELTGDGIAHGAIMISPCAVTMYS